MVLLIIASIGGTLLLSVAPLQRQNLARGDATQIALQQAKEALIGYAIAHHSTSGISPNVGPGQLPCPEDTNAIGTALEGMAQGNCLTNASRLGRFPWRTLKTGKLLDSNGGELWYAISPGFSSIPVNSTTIGQLSVNGIPNAAVAIIIAPGLPLAGQQRNAPTASLPPQPSDYLDLSNPQGAFVSTGSPSTFNDRVITITHAELFSAVSRVVLAEIRGLDDQAPNLPVRGLRDYFKNFGEFPWAALPGGNTAVPNKTLGSLPFGDLNYVGNSVWLSANNWLPLIGYTRLSANLAQIDLGTSTMTVLPCVTLPCP